MNNNLLEIQKKVIKYFSKKGIDIINEYDNLVWSYDVHYSKFSVILYFQQEYYSDDYYTITYHVNGANIRTYKKKTKTSSKNFCLTLYKNLLSFKKIFDENATELKIDTDLKRNYCIELDRYYSRLHHKIKIEVSTQESKEIDINITGYDYNFRHEAYYTIKYKNNKYYLISKSDYVKKNFNEMMKTF